MYRVVRMGVPAHEPKGAIKFDSLIAGIAHSHRARWLVTDDRRRHYRGFLDAVGSAVEIVTTTVQPAIGQTYLSRVLLPESPAATPGRKDLGPRK
jgi:hypothetical protein